MTSTFDASLLQWSLIWLAAALFTLARQWRPDTGVGLIFTFVLAFGVLHWLMPSFYLAPWFDSPRYPMSLVGLRVAAIAMLACAAGAEIGARLSDRMSRRRPPVHTFPVPVIDGRLSTFYLVCGIILYTIVTPLARNIPTVNALVSAGSTLAVGGVVAKCWSAYHRGPKVRLVFLIVATFGFPVVTVAGFGYLGYGFMAVFTVFGFIATIYQPRWRVLVLSAALGYVGMSVFVTYMRDRAELREMIATGAPLEARVGKVSKMFDSFEWFDIGDPAHLQRVEDRLNQSYLVGAAVAYIGSGAVPFANGQTLGDGFLALIPRMFWPDKHIIIGGNALVSNYTGMRFDRDTSVGIGEVMESYVNFGMPGVIIGFFLIAALTVLVDRGANLALRRGDGPGFLLWYMPGLAALSGIGDSFTEVTSSAGASIVLAIVINRVTNTWRSRLATAALPANMPPA